MGSEYVIIINKLFKKISKVTKHDNKQIHRKVMRNDARKYFLT